MPDGMTADQQGQPGPRDWPGGYSVDQKGLNSSLYACVVIGLTLCAVLKIVKFHIISHISNKVSENEIYISWT